MTKRAREVFSEWLHSLTEAAPMAERVVAKMVTDFLNMATFHTEQWKPSKQGCEVHHLSMQICKHIHKLVQTRSVAPEANLQ